MRNSKQLIQKIKFDFKYLDKIKDEPNPDAKKYALIDNIINQYEALEFTANTQLNLYLQICYGVATLLTPKISKKSSS